MTQMALGVIKFEILLRCLKAFSFTNFNNFSDDIYNFFFMFVKNPSLRELLLAVLRRSRGGCLHLLRTFFSLSQSLI